MRIHGYEVLEIMNHHENEWCRDYMPIVTSDNQLIQFKYEPRYMSDSQKWSHHLPDQNEIQQELNLICINENEIILDGGAIEIFGKQGIISDRVFRDNAANVNDLIEKIMKFLSLDRVIIVPEYPYDFTGHVDGMVRFIDKDTVLINDLTVEMEQIALDEKNNRNRYRCKLIQNWYYSFLMSFHNSGLKTEVLLSNYVKNKSDKDGNGIYLNFLKLPDLIVMPAYKDWQKDNEARIRLQEIYKREVITLNAENLAKEGGMINCITWTDAYSE